MDHLEHHGILGQKWGVRRFQNKDGSLTAEGKMRYKKEGIQSLINKGDTVYNIEKWGSSPNNNMLIVTGLSGSGKSTLANNIKNAEKCDVINLDAYYENPKAYKFRNKNFDKYLKEKVPEFNEITKNYLKYDFVKNTFEDETKEDKSNRNHYWKTMDKVRDAMLDFSKEQYGKKKVVSEGVQWLDTTLYPDDTKRKNVIKKYPTIIKGTSKIKSTIRGTIRDDVKITELLPFIKARNSWQKKWNISIKDLKEELK